ncbi:MAG: MATE family efflux transporter, partial [Clostridiales bacterium]|nr:MATE family efflux transporter [Clostridiales bacterium]
MLAKIKSLFGTQDMTAGKPSSRLLRFIIPMLVGNIAQLLLTAFDRAIVGTYLGDAALGAVGASMPILSIFMVFFMAVG